MTQRTLAGLLAVPLLVGLWVAAASVPLPYVTYEPGLTVDVLAENDGKEIIEVHGAQGLPRRRRAPDDHGLRLAAQAEGLEQPLRG